MLKFEYRLTERDFFEANCAHLRSQRFLYWLRWLISLLFIAIGLLYLVFAVFNSSFFIALLTGIIFLGGYALIPEPTINFWRRQQIGKIWQQSTWLHGVTEIEATEIELKTATPSLSTQIGWENFTHFIELPLLFVVYLTPRLIYIFPKRAFVDAAQIDEFRSLLQTHIRSR